jgi:hypothetical protein
MGLIESNTRHTGLATHTSQSTAATVDVDQVASHMRSSIYQLLSSLLGTRPGRTRPHSYLGTTSPRIATNNTQLQR